MRNTAAPAALAAVVTLAVTAAPTAFADGPKDTKPKMTVPATANPVHLTYPESKTVDVVDEYHGVKVPDPYRWLEDADSAETKAWVEAENRVTFAYLRDIPERSAIARRLTTLWDYEKYSSPTQKGGRYFYSKNDGLQNQSVLYVADSLDGTPRVLIDPNKLSDDGTVALAGTSLSNDGKYLAYAIAVAGSDWNEWRVRDVATGEDLPDHIKWVKFSGVNWLPDGSGFFYSRYDEPKSGKLLQETNYNQKVFFHKMGDSQEKDALIYERPDHPEWFLNAGVTDDGHYLVLYASAGTERVNRVYFRDLTAGADSPIHPLFEAGDAQYGVIDNDGTTFYVRTDKDAPLGRLLAVEAKDPSPAKWRTILPESKDTLGGVSLLGDELYANYLKDAHTEIRVYGLDGKHHRDISLPGIGSAGGFYGRRHDTETFYSFSGFTTPGTIYRYDLKTHQASVWKEPEVAFDRSQFVTEETFYTSKDGTRVPLFLTYKKGLKRDGSNLTYLYGYGGFNSSMTPYFSVAAVTWMEMGGVYAVACIRGGGEYGRVWHDAGRKLNKQNVFDDFIAAGEYLVREKYTSPAKLAIAGGSNGGLLVGACLEQRPDLFGAAVPAVGVMDMLRFVKFTIGWAWVSDYGSPENADEFKALYAYSPYHNLKKGTHYPATLVTTSDHDDRVVPAHSFKFAAALQSAQASDGPPVLIRVETRAGHGAGKPTAKAIEEVSDIYAFLFRSLGASLPADFGK